MLSIFKIRGASMWPYLSGGDFVIACRFFFRIRPNDIVIVDHPVYDRMIKRVADISSDKSLWLQGDNKASVTSQQMGWVSLEWVKAKVLFSIRSKQLLEWKKS